MNKYEIVKRKFFMSIVRSWWVICFFLFSFGIYNQSIKCKNRELCSLRSRFDEIFMKKKNLLQQKEELNVRKEAYKDPFWIEQLLIKELGVVPKGYIKIFFKKENS